VAHQGYAGPEGEGGGEEERGHCSRGQFHTSALSLACKLALFVGSMRKLVFVGAVKALKGPWKMRGLREVAAQAEEFPPSAHATPALSKGQRTDVIARRERASRRSPTPPWPSFLGAYASYASGFATHVRSVCAPASLSVWAGNAPPAYFNGEEGGEEGALRRGCVIHVDDVATVSHRLSPNASQSRFPFAPKLLPGCGPEGH